MLEMMLLGRKSIASGGDPASGPGPVDLIGYYNPRPGYETGLYGQVNGNGIDMISTDQLMRQTGNLGAAYNSVVIWMKYILDGQIIYVARNSPTYTLNYTQLYQQGLVYGVDGVGKYPLGSGVNQNKIVTWGKYKFRVRLMKCVMADPGVASAQDPFPNTSEWGRLMYPISNATVAADCENGEKWASLDLAVTGVRLFCQESSLSNTANSLTTLGIKTGGAASKTTTGQWRPLLELVP